MHTLVYRCHIRWFIAVSVCIETRTPSCHIQSISAQSRPVATFASRALVARCCYSYAMSRIFDTKTVPGANSSSSWEWCPGDTSEEKEEAPTASTHGDTTARIASLLAFSAAMKSGKHSTPCDMLCDSRGNGMS